MSDSGVNLEASESIARPHARPAWAMDRECALARAHVGNRRHAAHSDVRCG